MSIHIRELRKAFGKTVVCDDIHLDIAAGELVALLGPSGSGKTTLLRLIAGLEVPDAGSVHFHGEDATYTDVRERNVGFVFQHYALFNHLSVFENVAFGLRVKPRAQRPSNAEIERKVTALLDLVQLGFAARRFPHQLSGGQRQRIALARALAVEPQVLLLDEPFGALDAKVRKDLRRWLRRLHDEVHLTSVFVTHDQEEAMEVADRVVVMNQGRIEQVGTPAEVYDHPANPFVLQFIGDVNLFHGRGEVGYVRPHELEVLGAPVDGAWPAVLSQTLTVGAHTRIEFEREGHDGHLDVELPRDEYRTLRDALALERGSRVWLRPRRLRHFAAAPREAVVEDPAAVILKRVQTSKGSPGAVACARSTTSRVSDAATVARKS